MSEHEFWDHLPEGFKHLIDALSIGTMLGTLFQMLPNVAALLTIVWTLIRIWETKTVRGWLGRERKDGEGQL